MEFSKLLLIFMADHGVWIPGCSSDIYSDGTFDTWPEPFSQLYFIMGLMDPNKRAVLCVYSLLTDKEVRLSCRCGPRSRPWFPFQDGLHTSNKAELNTIWMVIPEAAIQATSIQAR
jgi:hypothetical protein